MNNDMAIKLLADLVGDMIEGLNEGDFEKEWLKDRLEVVKYHLEDTREISDEHAN